MPDDSERLVVMLEARVRDFEKKMEKASGTATRSYDRMRRGSRTATRQMEADMARASKRIGASVKTMIAGSAIGGLLSLAGTIAKAKDALADFDKTAKAARNSGLGSDLYQGLAHAADLAGLSVENLDQAMQAFRRNSALAATGKGDLVEKLKAVNPELLRELRLAKTGEERLRILADALKQTASETERVAIATAAFGKQGQKMLPVLQNGADGLDRVTAEAQKMGLVIDAGLLTKAEELTDQLSIASRVANAEFRKALVDLAPILVSAASLAANVASAVRSISDAFKGLSSKSTQGLRDLLAQERDRLTAAQTTRENRPAFMSSLYDRQITESRAKIAELEGELRRRATEELRIKLYEQSLQLSQNKPGEDESRKRAAEAAAREAEHILELINGLEEELRLIGATDAEREKSNALRQAGAAATEEQKRKIGELVDAIQREKDEQQKLQEAIDDLTGLATGFYTDFVNGLRAGEDATKSFGDSVVNMLNRIADKLAEEALANWIAALVGGGSSLSPGINRLIASGAGGLFADGGRITGPGTGTSDSIPIRASNGEYIVKASATKKHLGLLEAINNDRLMPFASGGLIDVRPTVAVGKIGGYGKKLT